MEPWQQIGLTEAEWEVKKKQREGNEKTCDMDRKLHKTHKILEITVTKNFVSLLSALNSSNSERNEFLFAFT